MKPFVWGDFYRKALRNGADHGYAAYAADRAEQLYLKRTDKARSALSRAEQSQ